ncbi:hypothetical protein D3C87_1643850 [compost metagenome]
MSKIQLEILDGIITILSTIWLRIDASIPIDLVSNKWSHSKTSFTTPGLETGLEVYMGIVYSGTPTGITCISRS